MTQSSQDNEHYSMPIALAVYITILAGMIAAWVAIIWLVVVLIGVSM